MVTRAVVSSSHHRPIEGHPGAEAGASAATERAGGSARAATSSSHGHSSTSSPESSRERTKSGRERRRDGKAKMLEQIRTLQAQNLALRRVIQALTEAIGQPSSSVASVDDSFGKASQRTSAELFDLFKDHVADAETQTDISVDLSRPDIFVHLPQQGISYATAHADAAAGLAQSHHDGNAEATLDFNARCQVYTSNTLALDSHAQQDPHSRQEPDVDNARHRDDQIVPLFDGNADALLDFNSQSLAHLSRPFALEIHARHVPLPRQIPDVDNARHRDQQMSITSSSEDYHRDGNADASLDFNSHCLAHSTRPLAPEIHAQHAPQSRQAPEVDNTRHREEQTASTMSSEPHHLDGYAVASFDLNSQSLAPSSGPFAFENHARHGPHPQREPEVDHPRHRTDQTDSYLDGNADAFLDFNSQSLANLSKPLALEILARQGPLPRQAPEADNARHRDECNHNTYSTDGDDYHPKGNADSSLDFNSQRLAYPSRPFALEIHAQQGPQPRQAPEVDNARHRNEQKPSTISGGNYHLDGCAAASLDFNSHSLSISSRPFVSEIPAQHSPHPTQVPQVDYARHRDEQKDSSTDLHLDGNASLDFNSQSLAHTSRPLTSEIHAMHGPLPRSAPEVVNARHRDKLRDATLSSEDYHLDGNAEASVDFNSQSLAYPSRPFAIEIRAQHSPQPRQEPDADNARHRESPLGTAYHLDGSVGATLDFNSQSLANSSRPSVFEIHAQHDLPPRLEPENDNARHRGKQNDITFSCKDYHHDGQADASLNFNSHTFEIQEHQRQHAQQAPDANNARHCASEYHLDGNADVSLDFNSQSLAHPSRPFALEIHAQRSPHPRQEPDDDNARHRDTQKDVTSSSADYHLDGNAEASLGFNSQCLANSSRPFALEVQARRMHKDPTPECCDIFDSIVKVYLSHSKPTSRQLQGAVRALVRVSQMHGVSSQACAEYVKARSLTVWCAFESHISK